MSAPVIPFNHNSLKIPQVGLGVYQAVGREVVEAVKIALNLGYRHIDTATYYQNEKQVAEGIRLSNVPREQLFITTKVWNSDQGYENTLKACQSSHSPLPEKRGDTWRAMEMLYKEGKVKSIGVSNYGIHHLKEMEEYTEIMPSVNQIEVTPFLQRKELVEYCQSKGIVIEASSPLTKGEMLSDNRLAKLAKKYDKSPAQILIRWGIEKGFVTLPKSIHERRIKENFDVFDFCISADDMAEMEGFDEGLVTGWDPTIWN